MKLLKKQKPVAPPAVALADQIRATCVAADQYIESKVRELKADPDHAILSIDWLRQDLKNRHGGNCSCRVALSLLSETKDG